MEISFNSNYYMDLYTSKSTLAPLTCACLISLRRHLIYTQSKNSKMLTNGRQQVCKHTLTGAWTQPAQGSGERKSPSGIQGQRPAGAWGQSTSLAKPPM